MKLTNEQHKRVGMIQKRMAMNFTLPIYYHLNMICLAGMPKHIIWDKGT